MEVLGEHRFDFAEEGGIGREGGDFEIEAEGAVVEVGGSHGSVVVGEEGLLVEKALRVAVEFDPEGDGRFVEGIGGEVDEEVVDFLREENADIDSADGGSLQGGEDAGVRDEIWRGDPEAFVGCAGGLHDEELP